MVLLFTPPACVSPDSHDLDQISNSSHAMAIVVQPEQMFQYFPLFLVCLLLSVSLLIRHDRRQLMHEFFRMGREERAKNLAEAERQRNRADKKELRFRRRLEDRFIEQTAAKARSRPQYVHWGRR